MQPRDRALETLAAETFDVVVIGGGITGAGVALDAAARGYSVALVEKADYASGTSGRSSKLIHGGLRYLQKFDLGLVREALLERQMLVRLAPHLVRPLKLVVPAFDGARPDRLVGIGLNMYDVMATPRLRGRPRSGRSDADWSPARHRMISGEEVLELLPALHARNPTGGYLFYDCQTDDARLVLTVLGEAERFGAICANRLEVVELVREEGRAAGVNVRDGESGSEFTIRAPNVVSATGVWADRIRPEELHAEAEVPTIRPSRGTHITLRQSDLPLVAGAIVPAGEGRSIFALPWLGRSLIGTTDNNYEGELEHVKPSRDDVAYLLEATNAFFGTELGPDDLTGAYAGVRPLISSGDTRKSVDISRKAELYETSSGLITITGGKLTTWRRMAKMAVDRLVERDGRDAPCRTDEIPLGQPADLDSLPDVEGVDRRVRAGAGRPLRPRGPACPAARLRARRARPADRPGSTRPAGRGAVRRPPRAGAERRRRAAAPHPARPARRPRAELARQRGAAAGGAGDGRRARAGMSGERRPRSSASGRKPTPRASWSGS